MMFETIITKTYIIIGENVKAIIIIPNHNPASGWYQNNTATKGCVQSIVERCEAISTTFGTR